MINQKYKKIVVLLCFLFYFFCSAMDVGEEKIDVTTLPIELQTHILSFLSSSDLLSQAVRNIQNLARTNKYFHELINDKQTMREIIKLLVKRFKYTFANNELDVIQKLERLKMPGTQNNQELVQWFSKRKKEIPQELAWEEETRKAIYAGNVLRVIELISKNKVDVNARGGFWKKPLLAHAVLAEQEEIALILLKAGANPNLRDMFGNIALMDALQKCSENMVQILLNAQSNPNTQNNSRHTPLMEAVIYNNSIKILQMLFDAGAERSEDAISLADRNYKPEIANFLKKEKQKQSSSKK